MSSCKGAAEKKGTATLAGVERELTQIKRRSRALLERMTKADGHIFGEWADAAHAEGEDRETATQEWLELKRLLEVSAERADMAAKEVMKNSPAVAKGSKGGRPPRHTGQPDHRYRCKYLRTANGRHGLSCD
jgi:hypothetical protein